MPSYEIVADPPAPRPEEMLVRDLVLRPGVEPVPEGQHQPEADFYVPYDEVGPGLYPDETVYLLDTGEMVAISARSKRDPSGGGMRFRGWARVINDDGSTMLDKHGAEMELSHSFPVDAGLFEYLDDPAGSAKGKIGREVALLMLGEPPTMVPIPAGDPEAPPTEVAESFDDWERNPKKAPPGTVLNPDALEAPLVGWSEELRRNVSIRAALRMFTASAPEIDVAALLTPAE